MEQSMMKNPNSVVLGSVKIELAEEIRFIEKDGKKHFVLDQFTDLGLGRSFSVQSTSTNIEIKADNGSVPISGKTNASYQISGNLLERHLPTLSKILAGQVHLSAQKSEKKSYTEVIEANTTHTFFIFPMWNCDGSVPADIVITQQENVLECDVDYHIEKIHDSWGIFFSPSWDKSCETKITYNVQSAKSWQMSHGGGGISAHYALRLTNKREADDGSLITRTWEFPYVSFEGDQNLSFKAGEDSDIVMEVPINFKATPHPEMIDDLILSQQSLMRETIEGNALDV
ncbi:MAG: hypothetical protein ACRCVN_05130 [Spirochaetia bacterium]